MRTLLTRSHSIYSSISIVAHVGSSEFGVTLLPSALLFCISDTLCLGAFLLVQCTLPLLHAKGIHFFQILVIARSEMKSRLIPSSAKLAPLSSSQWETSVVQDNQGGTHIVVAAGDP